MSHPEEQRRHQAVARYLAGDKIEDICREMQCAKSWLFKVDGNQLCEIGPHRQRMTVTSLAEAVPPAR